MQVHVTDFYQEQKHAMHYLERRHKNLLGQFRHARQIALINQFVKENQIVQALEIACGPARLTVDIEGIQSGVGIDASLEMLWIGHSRIDSSAWKFCVADVFSIPFVQSFELIFSGRFIWHFPPAERQSIYQRVSDLLAPNGYFIFDTLMHKQFMFANKQKPMYEQRYRSLDELALELEENGLQMQTAHAYIKHPQWQHSLALFGDITGLKRLTLPLLHAIESLPSTDAEEYLIVCRKQ